MASKAFVLLGLFAVLLVVSGVVAASDSLSGTVNSESKKTVQPDQYGRGPGGGYNGGGGNYNGGGGNYNGGGGNYNGGGGNYNGGHGGGNYNGGHGGGNYNGGGGNYNGGGRGRGGFCRHGCCYRGYRSCLRCCSYAGEAVQTQPGH